MNVRDTNHTTHYFLSGGGEMGELTRSFDWSQTALGNPDQWPHSLKTTLGILLHSAFPMFLFWGDDLICFYNDAYRPSLGINGKHPALGKKAKEVWPDIWDFIGPLIKKVLETNEAVWYEDKLLPIYRNGRMEDVYWTFSYSPVYGDEGKVSGVFVTCTETTEKVYNQKRLEESELKFRKLIAEMPLAACVFKGKELIVDVVNEMAIQSWGKGPNVLGKPLNKVLPEIVDQPYLQILADVFTTGQPYFIESAPFTLIVNGAPKPYIKKIIFNPLRGSDGNIHSILAMSMDVSERIEAQQLLEQNLRQLVSYFEQTPVAIATIDKEDLTFRLVNPFYAELVGRKAEDIVNKPLLEALPELKGQGFDLLLENVIRTGEAYSAFEVAAELLRNNKLERVYVNLTYQPQIDIDGNVSGILVVATDVTQQVVSRKKVEASELKLRKVIEESPVATALFKGKDLIIDVANDFVIEMYGQGPNIIGKPLQEVLQNGEHFIKILNKILETGLPHEGKEAVYQMMVNGITKTYIMDFIYKPLIDAEGKVESILAVAVNVTKQVIARKTAEESEQKLRTIVANAPAAIAMFMGRKLIIENPNQTFIDVAGKGPDIIGKPLAEAIPELKDQPFLQMLDDVFTSGKTVQTHGSLIKIIQHGMQVEKYYDFTYTPILDSNGKVYAILDIAIDVTEQMLNRQKLEKSEQEIRSLIESAPFPIAVYIGREMRIQFANQNIIDVWGKGNNVIGKLFSEILPELDNQQIFEQLDNVYTTGIPFHAKNQRVDLVVDNILQSYYFNYSFTPLFDADGTVYGVMNTAAEVTDLNLAKLKIEEIVSARTRELATANDKLQKSNAELAQFAYIASHDLQEPLRKISMFTQLLESRIGNDLDAHSKIQLNKISSAAIRMNTLIKDVLSYSELIKETEEFVTIDLNQIVENTLVDFELLIEQKNVLIQYQALPNIEAIPLQMSQLFGNLIGNALKFSRTDIKPMIIITSSVLTQHEKQLMELNLQTEYYKIMVSDNGIGMNPENIDKIFNIFQRLHRKSEYEGTGIGLAMCKKIALNHKGNLNAIGSSEKGAVFNVILPMSK